MKNFLDMHVADYMTRGVMTVDASMTLRELEALLETRDYNILPVTECGAFAGIVTKYDFLKAFVMSTSRIVPRYDELMAMRAGDVMTRSLSTIKETARLTRALQMMVEHKVRSIPVVDAVGGLSGVISRGDIMRALREATSASSAAA